MSSSVVNVGVLVCHLFGELVILLLVLGMLVYHSDGRWVVELFVWRCLFITEVVRE